jgi:hypothetical protein
MPSRRNSSIAGNLKAALPVAAVWAVAGAMAALAAGGGSVNVPRTSFRLEDSVVWLLAALAAASALLPALRKQALRCFMFAGSLLALLALFTAFYRMPALGDRSYGLTHWRERIYSSASEWYEPITAKHPVYGFGGAAGAEGLHFASGERLIRYSLDDSGWRHQQKETQQPEEIWFLGSELPFGLGLSDGDGFVDRLAMVWRDHKVRNFSHKWFSTANVYRILEQEFNGIARPKTVILSWSSADRRRNFLRKSWFQNLPDLDIPVFDVEAGRLKFLGLKSSREAQQPDNDATDRKELEITDALIRGMARMCAKDHIPFVLLVLRNEDRALVEGLRESEPNLQVWDMSDTERSFSLGGREWHQAVAHRALNEKFLANLLEKPSLLSPGAYLPPKVEVVRRLSQPVSMRNWQLEGPSLADATMTFPTNDRVRVAFAERKYRSWWDLRLVYPISGIQLKAGEDYTMEWKFKAKEVKRILSRIEFEGGEPDIIREATITSSWQTAKQTLSVPRDATIKRIVLSTGQDSIQFEVAMMRLYSDKTDMDVLSPTNQLALAEQPSDYWLPDLGKLEFWSQRWYDNAVLHRPTSAGEPLRLTQRGWTKGAGSVQLKLPFAIRKGSTYSVHLDVRSSDPRKLSYGVMRNEPPWNLLSEGEEFVASIHWQRSEKGFFSDKDIPKAAVALYLGGSPKPVEIRTFQVLEDGRNIMLPRLPQANTAAAAPPVP